MSGFEIHADEFKWINGPEDDPNDLCLHGHVVAQIGDTVLEDTGTVSATALYLLKTLKADRIMNGSDAQMIPCCGFFWTANKDLSEVGILGCDAGTDWSTIHEDGHIKIVLESGKEEHVDFSEYRDEVFRFADEIEAYYKRCKPKIVPEDEFSRNGYIAFWNEWRRLREEQA